MTQPPRIAMWMLKHFGSGPDNDTLLGDLAEQYQRNGNAMWYRRQALGGIVVSFFKEIWGHKWIAGTALLTGWFVWFALVTIIPPFPRAFYFQWFVNGIEYPLFIGMLCGWTVGYLHRNHRTAAVLLFAVTVLLQYLEVLWRIIYYLQPRAVILNAHLYVSAAFLGILLGGGLLFGKTNNVTVED